MGAFRYEAVNAAGEVRAGLIEAESEQAAVSKLTQSGLVPLSLREAQGSFLPGWLTRIAQRRARLSHRQILLMTQELASLTKAGLTLDRALAVALKLTADQALRRVIESLLSKVRQGRSFADALQAEQDVFPGYYIGMIKAGEAGGSIDEILGRLATLLARSQEIRDRVSSALIYPAILVAMIGATLVLILRTVLPRFETLFAEAGAELPLPTQVVLWISQAFRNDGGLMLLVMGIAAVFAAQLWSQPAWRLRLDRRLVTTRWLLGLVCKSESARFARTFGTLLAGGLPLPRALRIAADTFWNTALRRASEEVLQGVKEGQGLADRLARAALFPPLLVQMAQVGEETGRLGSSLIEAADILDQDVQRIIERLLTLMVPALTIIMGLIVAALIGSVLVGILSVNDLAL